MTNVVFHTKTVWLSSAGDPLGHRGHYWIINLFQFFSVSKRLNQHHHSTATFSGFTPAHGIPIIRCPYRFFLLEVSFGVH